MEDGFDVPLERVADRASVGRATLYRNFPDRQSLALAVLQIYLDDLAAKIAACGDRDDAFFVGIKALAELTIATNGFAKVLTIRRQSPQYIQKVRGGIQEVLAKPLARAKAAGLIRQDFPITDIHYLPVMIAAGGISPEDGDVQAGMKRAMDLLSQGFAPPN